jgi:hypothetical protein
MAQNVVLKNAGIHTFPNYLSSIPEGALTEALNVVIDRNNIIEPRRGFFAYGNTFGASTDRVKQLFNYKNRVLRHVNSSIQYDSDEEGTFSTITGTVNEVETGLRIKGIESNSNFYFVSSDGMRKIAANSAASLASTSIEKAGGPKALDVIANTNFTSSGFLSPNSLVAYKIVWGKKDANENLLLGSPSSRTVVENISPTQSCIVDLEFQIPADVTTIDWFYQVYRTGVFTSPTDPGEEMNLVFEDFVTTGQLTAEKVTTTDITPEDFRKGGALLYVNPVSGEGIEQANEKPPFAKDITLYKGYTFLGNTSTVQRLNLSVISIQSLVSETSEITITDGTTSTTYRFRGTIETYTADFSSGALTKADFQNPGGPGKYFTIDSANDQHKYAIWYKDTTETDPMISGRLSIMIDISAAVTTTDIRDATLTDIDAATDDFNLTAIAGPKLTIANSNNGYVTAATQTTNISDFTISTDGAGTGEDSSLTPPRVFLPRVPTGTENGPTTSQQIEQMSRSLVKIINEADPLVYAYYLSGFNDVPGQILLEHQDTTGAAFYITASSTGVGSQFNPALPTTGSSVISTNEVKANRVYYSKYQQPEAFPLVNYIDIGPKDKAIKRIIALRDSLFIFKEDGIYRLTGDTAPFQVAPFDFSVQVLSPDTAVVLNNQIYAFSTQGVITVTDTGVSVISRPIENLLLSVAREGYDFKKISFGVSYESDRAYFLWTVTNPTDEVATQCFRYNTFTNAWTRWDKSATAGIVNFADDKLYLGAGDGNFVDKERKSLTRVDHADREFSFDILQDGVNSTVVDLNTVTDIEVGDRMIQTQYMTIAQYNRLLNKLDVDPSVNDTNYFSTLEFSYGDNSRTHIQDLATKLDADLGVSDTDYFAKIDDYVQTITSTTPGAQTVISFASNDILQNRYVTISGSNTTPSIDGTHKVVASTATTITIDVTTTIAGSAGTVQTAVQDLRDVQACFNIIVNKLNNDSGVFYSSYLTSSGSAEYEAIITDVDNVENTITISQPIQLVESAITVFKAFQTTVQWAPQPMGDPTVWKQVYQGTLIFENSNFSEVTVSYGNDLSPGFDGVTCPGLGDGDWGYSDWGLMNWGGIGAAIPVRTYVPKQKQRCRFMNVKFDHRVALEKFNIYGFSLTFRPYSTRSYR